MIQQKIIQNLDQNQGLSRLTKTYIDQGNNFYDQAYTTLFYQKLEKMQWNACLSIKRATCDTSNERLYKELRLESVKTSSSENYASLLNFSE